MRTAMWGALGGALVSLAAVWAMAPGQRAEAQAPAADRFDRALADGLVALPGPVTEGRQQITIIDPKSRVLSVYGVEANGAITLKSVRNIHWDLLMEEFNGGSPSPREIRSLLQQK